MPIKLITLTDFRNIAHCSFECSPVFNVFYGDNAAGKTSLLEALYFLSTGKSFRTSQLDTIIQHDKTEFSLFIKLQETNNLEMPIGISRDIKGSRKIRLNDENITSIAKISSLLPIQFIGTNSHRILVEGPRTRRQFIDWGLFHTNAHFHEIWKSFQKLLSQRNAALKARASNEELASWNSVFSKAGEQLNSLRTNYILSFFPTFKEIVAAFLNNESITFNYLPGWPKNEALLDKLNQSGFREQQAGHSLYGPQRADLQILVNGHHAHDVLSQGQQKLLSYALRLAQSMHLHAETNKESVYLIDDLPSELDPSKRALVFEALSSIKAQVFITGIEPSQLSDFMAAQEAKLFHVKQGKISVIDPE